MLTIFFHKYKHYTYCETKIPLSLTFESVYCRPYRIDSPDIKCSRRQDSAHWAASARASGVGAVPIRYRRVG